MLHHDDKTLQGNELMLIHLRSDGIIHWADENFLRYMEILKVPVLGQHKDVLLKSTQLKVANILIHTPANLDRRVEAVDEQGDLFEVKITWKENEAHIVIENIDRKKQIKKETVFGKFTLIEQIGRGGTAEVWKARDDDWGIIVAVKKMIAGTNASKANIKRFLKEAELMKQLNHNNICHIHEVGQHEGVYFISMEYIDGIDLSEYISSNTFLKDKHKLKVIKDILSAVQHAHDNHIIHRDLKPANIMMRTNGEPVVMDFGLARIIDTEHTITLDDQVVGTVDYMSPEQAQASPDIDERTDLFSVGAIMYYLLTGQKWFTSTGNIFRDTKLIQKREVRAPRQLRTNLSKRLETITLKALEKSPKRRYQSAINFMGDIIRFEKNQKIIARPPSVFTHIGSAYSKNKIYFWAIFCIVGILMLSSALIYGQRLKELATWDLVYQEDFSQYQSSRDLSKNWIGYYADSYTWSKDMIKTFEFSDSSFWHLDSGYFESDLSKSNIFCANLTFKKRIHGNIRVEWKMKGLEHNLNYDAYIAGETRYDGYTFHLGGWDNEQYFVLTKGRDALILDYSIQDNPLETDREYRFIMEKEDKHIRLYMDGKIIFDYFDYNILEGKRNRTFGFDNCLRHTQQVYDIKVFTQAVAQKISPIAIGDAFFDKDQYYNALEQYDQIAKAYHGTSIAQDALYKKALCFSKLKKDSIAYSLFRDFEQQYPDHDQIPYSLYERALILNSRKDSIQERGLYIKLSKSFPGHPILKPIFFKKGTTLLQEIQSLTTTNHDEIVSKIMSNLEQVKIWSNIFDIDFENNPFSQPIYVKLLELKEYDIVLDNFGNSDYVHIYDKYAQLLFRMQQYDQIKMVDNYTAKLIVLSQLKQKKFQEVRHSIKNHIGQDDILATLFGVDAPDFLISHFVDQPQYPMLNFNRLYSNSNYSAILDSFPNDNEIRAKALIGLGKYQEAITQYPHSLSSKAWATYLKKREPYKTKRVKPSLFYSLSTNQNTQWKKSPHFRNTVPITNRYAQKDSAFHFDDSHFIDSPLTKLNSSFTISTWVHTYAVPTNRTHSLISLQLDNKQTISMKLKNIEGSLKYMVLHTTPQGTQAFNSHTEATNGNWLHIALAVSKNHKHFILYINGQFDSLIPMNHTTTKATIEKVFVGADATSRIQFYNGGIDDVGIFNRALELEEIRTLFKK